MKILIVEIAYHAQICAGAEGGLYPSAPIFSRFRIYAMFAVVIRRENWLGVAASLAICSTT